MAGVFFPGPVGLGAGLDIRADATRALAQLGFGFIEVGPVTLFTHTAPGRHFRLEEARALARPDCLSSIGAEALADRLNRASPLGRPVIVRLAHAPGVDHHAAAREVCLVASRLASYASIFTLEVRSIIRRSGWTPDEWIEFVNSVADGLLHMATPRPLFLCLPPDCDGYDLATLLPPAIERGIAGVLIAGGQRADDHVLVGAPTRDASLRLVEQVRFRWGDRLAIIGSGGIIEPADALRLIDAGASLVQVHSGLIYSGPGLPKRINEAIAFQDGVSDSSAPPPQVSPRALVTWPSWVWFTLFSVVMLVGGLLVSIAGATRIIFPYDEAFVGLTRAEIVAVNDRLLPFMMHDRVTLGAALIALGVIYFQLSTRAVRLGFGWAPRAIWVSSIPGFASFFLFLGHGYFDPL
ncbi:MAG TPA: dihydroorotate dehydrogenase, partial [Chloroflexota bacterium]|nr:dihydroorotate dehydrogenase [Chloroflexota bacterium]